MNPHPTCLLVTENRSVRSFVKKHLDDQFFIIESSKPSAILDTIRHSKLDLILLDGQIENCLKLCKEMKEVLYLNPTPILLITGRLKKAFRDEALDAGVSDFLSENLDADELETRIATARKALAAREKTADLSSAIRPTQPVSSTYLKNKTLLHDHALRLLTSAKGAPATTALLLIQIDQLNRLQAELGVWTTDSLFVSLSQLIQQFLKNDDLLISSSGNRLILLLNQTDLKQAKVFAESLRKEVEHHMFYTPKGDRWITISIVYSQIESSEASFEKMLETSIKALNTQNQTNLILNLEPS